MFKLFEEEVEKPFTWQAIGSAGTGRENLGSDMPVFMYRLFQYSLRDELTKRYGKEQTADIFRNAGELAGIAFAENLLNLELPFEGFMAHLRNVLEEHRVGVLRVESFDPETGRAVLTIGEDLDCSGLPMTGETVCNYDEGFLAGVLKTYTKKDYVVTEVDCWATGARVCRFEAVISVDNDG